MIKRVMSACKIGAPKVDLILDETETKPGGKISGSIHVKGGWTSQKTKRLECDLVRHEAGDSYRFVAPAKTILTAQVVDANERRELPFHYQLPNELKPTSDGVSYHLMTKLVFKDDSKCSDQDEIVIRD